MTEEERHIEFDKRIDRYLRNLMSAEERAAFEQDVDNDQELRERLVATSLLVQGIARDGMRREGQAQLNAIGQMSQDEFNRAIKRRKPSRAKALGAWAAGIAAALVLIVGFKAFYPTLKHQPEMAKERTSRSQKPVVSQLPEEPTLASLADEFNKPFDGEPDDFVSIREQIKKGGAQDMMAVVEDIDKLEWPTAKHGPKGADDEEVFKSTLDNYNACTLWYKALAHLKADDKENALKELDELVENGKNEELVNRASALLKQLKE